MTGVLTALFWISIIGATYSYFLYPIVLLTKRRRETNVNDPATWPKVSLVISAFNEETRIAEKLRNTLALDYPRELLQIIVASDASSDKTNEITRSFAPQGIELIESTERKGKEHVQKLGIDAANGEIVLFSDVSARLPPASIRNVVKYFTDPRVGAVSSEDRFISPDGQVVGEGVYLKYEMWLRRLESQVHTIIGLTGAFFAVRREICSEWDTRVPSDFNAALNCLKRRQVAVSAPDVLCYYPNITEDLREYHRKVRTVIRGLSALCRRPSLLNPFAYGFAAFQLCSHKVARWLVPWFLLLLFVSTAWLAPRHSFYQFALGAQALFYLAAIGGAMSRRLRSFRLISIPCYFTLVNLAVAHAMIGFALGKRIVAWEPSKR